MSTVRLRKEVRALVDWAAREHQAQLLGLTRGGHVAVGLPNGERVVLPSTPSDRRSMLNAKAQVRRSAARGSTAAAA